MEYNELKQPNLNKLYTCQTVTVISFSVEFLYSVKVFLRSWKIFSQCYTPYVIEKPHKTLHRRNGNYSYHK